MIIKDLITILKRADQNKEVYLASDEEGNSFGNLDNRSVDEERDKVIIYPTDTLVYEELK